MCAGNTAQVQEPNVVCPRPLSAVSHPLSSVQGRTQDECCQCVTGPAQIPTGYCVDTENLLGSDDTLYEAHTQCSAVMRFAGCGGVSDIERCAGELQTYRDSILPENWGGDDYRMGHQEGVISPECFACYDDAYDKFEWSATYHAQEMQDMCVRVGGGSLCTYEFRETTANYTCRDQYCTQKSSEDEPDSLGK